MFTRSKSHSCKVCSLRSSTFYLQLLSATNRDCTLPSTYFRCLSHQPSSITNFFPSPLLISNSKKSGYHFRTTQAKHNLFKSSTPPSSVLYVLTRFNMVSNMKNIKVYLPFIKVLTQTVAHKFVIHIKTISQLRQNHPASRASFISFCFDSYYTKNHYRYKAYVP